jgi:translocation and assembly module TamB
MKRFLVYGSLALLLGVLVGGGLALKWLLEDPDGVRWLLRSVSRHTPVTVNARTVTGGLGSALRLEGFSARWSEGELAVADLRLRCEPLLIPFGTLAVQELALRGVRLRDHSPPLSTGPELVWPRISGAPTMFNAWVDLLSMEDVSYQKRDQPPLSLPNLSAALAWRDSRLSVSRLSLAAPGGRLSGTVTVGLGSAALLSDLTYEPLRPLAGCSRFQLRTRLRSARSPEQVAGEVTVAAMAGKNTRYTLSGALGLTRKELNLHGLTLTEKGRRGSIQAAGTLSLPGAARVRLSASGLDLTPELGEKMALSGTLDLGGWSGQYEGRFNLAASGEGWRKIRVAGALRGNPHGADLSGIDAAFLSGKVRGNLRLGWRDELTLRGSLQGEGLDPARLDPTWNGVVNFDLQSMAAWAGGRLRQAEANGRLLKSRLRGRALAGEVAASLHNDDLRIKRLFLKGAGFDIHASGILSQRLDLTANIRDLSGLIPKTSGRVALKGWGRYGAGIASGELSGHGHELAAEGVQVESATLKASLAGAPERSLSAAAELKGVKYHGVAAKHASLTADGSLGRHRLALVLRSAGAEITGKLTGGYGEGSWQGELTTLSGRDQVGPWRLAAPAGLTISREALTIKPLVLTGLPSERAELSGRLLLLPLRGSAQVAWSGLDLARAGQWLVDARLAGRSSGNLGLEVLAGDRLTLQGKASASGTATMGGRTVTIQKALIDLHAGERGTTAMLEFRTGEGISVTGRFNSPDPATLAVPCHGDLHASWEGLDPALARRWLPGGLELQGRLAGELSGKLLPESRFDLNGTVTLSGGEGLWRDEGRELKAAVRSAGITWNWRGNSLSGELSMSLAGLGETRGNFQLPLPARLGAVPNPEGPVRGELSGRFQEKGILTTLFPGLIQESKGVLDVDMRAGGSWQAPTVTGTIALEQAGAYLPAAGIRLTDVRLAARLDGTWVHIESFRLTSGPGSLAGSADISFAGRKLAGYRGTLRGERFQAVHLPELQLMVTPEISFEGNLGKFSASGLIRIPEMQVNSLSSSTVIRPSRDVVVTGREAAPSGAAGTSLDLKLRLLLGDKVNVKSEGLDARLEGGINLHLTGPAAATGSGEIRVAKGSYRIYGVNLDIKRGRAIFSGGPVQRPTLDILALREVDEIKAGVAVSGTPEKPLIKLYSEPALPDTDILAYVVLGHKLGESGEQAALLMQAAALLGSSGQSQGVQERLKELVKLDTITVTSSKERSSVYKPIEPSLRPTSESKKESGGVSQTMLQIGKYLTPKLYVSYGRSLFTESQELRARYTISKKWEVESRVSPEGTGGDLFYRIELE